MAESDAGPRATGAVSTEEAERLSERFRPSWEDDPPTVPREPISPPAAAKPVPAPVIAVPAVAPKAAPTQGGHDDLDWELPTNPLPEAAPTEPNLTPAAGSPPVVAADSSQTQKLPAVIPVAARAAEQEPAPELEVQLEIEEVPSSSKPSGIGEKYVPKEEGAPPVVLHDELRKAEVGAQAAIEAQHRARRAPTIARMKVAEIIPSAPAVEDVPFAPPRRRSYGGLAGLGIAVVAIAALGTVLLGRNKTTEPVPPPAAAPATIAPDTAAPPPPPPPAVADTAAPATPDTGTASAEAPGEPPPKATAPAAKGSTSEPPKTPTTKATATSKAVAASSKAPPPKATATAKPAPAPPRAASRPVAGTPKAASGRPVIVRDSPF